VTRISSDPHASLPYYAQLLDQPGFSDLAVTHQFAQLVEAIADEYPKQADSMREYNDANQRATLGHLRNVQQQQPLDG
jgi:hypothetical protein